VRFEERGTVAETRGRIAIVRLQRSASCAGCASAGTCRAGRDAGERLLESRNAVGAAVGDAVVVALPAQAVIGASAGKYVVPVAGLLAGAGAAQLLAGALISAAAGGTAAGIGGIAGALLGILLGRRLRKGSAAGGPLPEITRIVAGVDSLPDHG
jgi:positive regulator of sigma E activity